jgi:hypothetical protein
MSPEPSPEPTPEPTPTPELSPVPTPPSSGPTASGPFGGGDETGDGSSPKKPDEPGENRGEAPPYSPDYGTEDVEDDETSPRDRLGALGRYAVEAVQRLAFPLALALMVAIFLLVQHFLDRRSPKLAFAPVHSEYDRIDFSDLG